MIKNIFNEATQKLRDQEFKHIFRKNFLYIGARDIINKMLDWKYDGEKIDAKTIRILMTNTRLVAKMSKNDEVFLKLLIKQPELIKDVKTKAFAETILIGYFKANPKETKKILPIFGLDKVPDELPDCEHRGPTFDIPNHSNNVSR